MAPPAPAAFPEAGEVFRDLRLPETARPAGYAALLDAFELDVPLPRQLSAIGTSHRVYKGGRWKIFTPRHEPDATPPDHLTFALKYEGLGLAVLKRLFEQMDPLVLEEMVRDTPTGKYARRLWF